tara:strand:+ start:224 stop:1225 length:1002 start_codon:yes stop_codon:yes gene_type:complete
MNWVKARSFTKDHNLVDSVRGAHFRLIPNGTNAENEDAEKIISLDSDGFTTGVDGATNDNTETYAAWNWKAGGAPTATNSAGAGATPTAGSVKIDGSNLGSALAGTIPATKLSANTTSGFSIITWEGTGAIGTVAHGLSVAPELVIVKNFDMINEWPVGTDKGGYDFTDYLRLDGNRAMSDDDRIWNDTPPSPTVFTVGAHDSVNESGDGSVSYCFHSVDGYSKVGAYTGNGDANGTFVYTGFKPKFVIVKNANLADDWEIYDGTMNPYNYLDLGLKANTNGAEYALNSANRAWDFVSNGFKVRGTNGGINQNNDEMIFLAVAESPFKTSNAR